MTSDRKNHKANGFSKMLMAKKDVVLNSWRALRWFCGEEVSKNLLEFPASIMVNLLRRIVIVADSKLDEEKEVQALKKSLLQIEEIQENLLKKLAKKTSEISADALALYSQIDRGVEIYTAMLAGAVKTFLSMAQQLYKTNPVFAEVLLKMLEEKKLLLLEIDQRLSKLDTNDSSHNHRHLNRKG